MNEYNIKFKQNRNEGRKEKKKMGLNKFWSPSNLSLALFCDSPPHTRTHIPHLFYFFHILSLSLAPDNLLKFLIISPTDASFFFLSLLFCLQKLFDADGRICIFAPINVVLCVCVCVFVLLARLYFLFWPPVFFFSLSLFLTYVCSLFS